MAAVRVKPTIAKKGKKAAAKTSARKVKPAAKVVRKSPSKALAQVKAVVINLARRPDRWLKAQHSVGKAAPWLKVERLDAVDGAHAPPSKKEVTSKWSTANLAKLFHWYKSVTVGMSPGERGCCGSHIAAWRMAAKGKKPLIVLEDDAVALPTFTGSISQALAEAPKDVGMVFLSSKDRGSPKRVGKVLMEPDFVWTTVGYVIWPAAAKKLLKMLPVDMPVDNFLAWHIKVGAIKAFSVKPAAVRQANTWNVGSDVPHSDDVAH
mmetsp:Transcript_51338/g.83271  ORF Transcript_51338/g.83271 Transcript_51338/m.83271 type:complete len:264 (-) Transcript_51338:310-1101(-)